MASSTTKATDTPRFSSSSGLYLSSVAYVLVHAVRRLGLQ
jgi:hypothetical protein